MPDNAVRLTPANAIAVATAMGASLIRRQIRRARPTWLRGMIPLLELDTLSPPAPYRLPPSGGLVVLAPHPDDESIGCGALIAAFRAAGRAVDVVVLTDGAMGSAGDRIGPSEALAALRRRETSDALGRLGGGTLAFLALPDGRLIEHVAEARASLVALLRQRRPAVIAFPALYDRHPDHVACTPILLDALAAAGDAGIELLGYETWAAGRVDIAFDATPHMGAKLAAIACHRSQTAQRDYGAALEGLARYRAVTSLCPGRYAETFWTGSATALGRLWRAARS